VRLTCVLALVSVGTAFPGLAQNPNRAIRAIGEFSNLRHTEDDHAYGYVIELWRDGDSAIGLLFVAQGLQPDMPAGMIENIRFDSRTGALSFTAKLSTGAVLLPGGRQEPTRDLFVFSGTLTATALTGTIQRSDQRQPGRAGSQERVQLKIRQQATMFAARSYAEWKDSADEILKYRGPKW
jgi:hypothetical protein